MELIRFVQTAMWLFLIIFILIILYKLLIGEINTRMILFDKKMKVLSAGRIQLLLFTVFGAIYYLLLISENVHRCIMPKVPDELLILFGASNITYLGGKYKSLIKGR